MLFPLGESDVLLTVVAPPVAIIALVARFVMVLQEVHQRKPCYVIADVGLVDLEVVRAVVAYEVFPLFIPLFLII